MQDRLPTRHNLWKRGVITDAGASRCVLCGLVSESADHFVVSCNQISLVWYVILRWLGVEWVSPRGILGCFEVKILVPPVPFTIGVCTLFLARTGRVCRGVRLDLRDVWLIGGLL
ncbi:hypothetical protein A2U01_0006077 [Trifolium medium]|uniref:Reverse transcriptase zinc-binding domain-containing protein n=1 Tax=Trifolium medium TaxID=97028 RepID=A0A392MDL7_9FABA|nr:hypothetical protein [Trifolium medium]